MTESSMVWTGVATGDATFAPYTADKFSDYLRDILQYDRRYMGVIPTAVTAVGVTDLTVSNPAGVTIRVSKGNALVDGTLYRNTDNVDNVVVAPGAGSNFYTVVLRKSWALQTVRVALVGPNAVAPPAVTQTDGTTWEISLATVEITSGSVVTVTDTRAALGSIAATFGMYGGVPFASLSIGPGSFIAGGSYQLDPTDPVVAANAVMIGGNTHLKIEGDNSVIIGGNTCSIANAAADNSGIFASESSQVSAVRSVVIGGGAHSISSSGSDNAIVGGGGATGSGAGNSLSGNENFMGGGSSSSIISASGSAIIGGYNNGINSGGYSSIVSGEENDIVTATHCVVIGGYDNEIEAAATHTVIAGGQKNRVEADHSLVAGLHSRPLLDRSFTLGAGYYSSNGERGTAQSMVVNVGESVAHSDANWHRLYININAGTGELSIPTDTAWIFEASLIGTSQGCVKTFAFKLLGAIENDGGTTALKGSVTKTTIDDSDDVSFDCQAIADDVNDSLAIEVQDTDAAGDTVRWACNVHIVQVTYPA